MIVIAFGLPSTTSGLEFANDAAIILE